MLRRGVIAIYPSTGPTPNFTPIVGYALVSIVATLTALIVETRVGAVLCLYLSMTATAAYLHELVSITGGTTSPFHHLYLYLPAVVLLVSQHNHEAELLASILVLISYFFNLAAVDT